MPHDPEKYLYDIRSCVGQMERSDTCRRTAE